MMGAALQALTGAGETGGSLSQLAAAAAVAAAAVSRAQEAAGQHGNQVCVGGRNDLHWAVTSMAQIAVYYCIFGRRL